MENNFRSANKLEALIAGLTLEELYGLHRIIANRINLMQRAGTLVAMSQFAVGDRVSWYSNNGTKHIGEIFRINHKTVSVRIHGQGYWNISPQLLQKEV